MGPIAINSNSLLQAGLGQLIIVALAAIAIILVANFAFKRWAVPFLTAKAAKNMDNQHLHAREVCLQAEETGTGMDVLLRNLDYQFSHVISHDKKESSACLKQ